MTEAKKAIELNKEQPHLDTHQIVLSLSAIEDRLDLIEKKHGACHEAPAGPKVEKVKKRRRRKKNV